MKCWEKRITKWENYQILLKTATYVESQLVPWHSIFDSQLTLIYLEKTDKQCDFWLDIWKAKQSEMDLIHAVVGVNHKEI